MSLSIHFEGRSQSCPPLKFIGSKVASMLCCCNCTSSTTTDKYRRLDAKLERKVVELKRQALASCSGHQYKQFRSINSIIMKFPQLKEQVKNLRGVFEKYGAFLATKYQVYIFLFIFVRLLVFSLIFIHLYQMKIVTELLIVRSLRNASMNYKSILQSRSLMIFSIHATLIGMGTYNSTSSLFSSVSYTC